MRDNTQTGTEIDIDMRQNTDADGLIEIQTGMRQNIETVLMITYRHRLTDRQVYRK